MLLSIEKIVPDPLNMEIYSMDDVLELAETISKKGFFGEIVVYPIENDKYMIESGHRRYEAARLCDYKEIPVSVSDPPMTTISRRERLIQWNLHNRRLTPMTTARSMQFQYETYSMVNEERKRSGLKAEPILPKIAQDFDCSESSVKKYRMLLGLIPELQEMADSGDYSWSVLAKASVLSEPQQRMLYMRIKGKTRLLGPSAASSSWIESEIKSYEKVSPPSGSNEPSTFSAGKDSYLSYINSHSWKHSPVKEKHEPVKENPKPVKSNEKRHRRCDSAKLISNSRSYLEKSMNEDNLLKYSDREETIRNLKEMRDMIDRKLHSLENG